MSALAIPVEVRRVASVAAEGRDAAELRNYLCGHEATIGFGSNHLDMCVALNKPVGVRRRCEACKGTGDRGGCRACLGGGSVPITARPNKPGQTAGRPENYDGLAARVDHAWHTARKSGRARTSDGLRVWRALRLLVTWGQDESVIVLARLYGEDRGRVVVENKALGFARGNRWVPNKNRVMRPSDRWTKAFGLDGAALAPLTRAAAEARDELACEIGIESESSVRLHCVATVAFVREDLEREFWRAARLEQRHRDRACRLPSQALHEEHRLAEAWRTVQGNALEALATGVRTERLEEGGDGQLGASLSALAAADHETTVEEAIILRMADKDRARRDEFAEAVRRDSADLKTAAHGLYAAAKRAS